MDFPKKAIHALCRQQNTIRSDLSLEYPDYRRLAVDVGGDLRRRDHVVFLPGGPTRILAASRSLTFVASRSPVCGHVAVVATVLGTGTYRSGAGETVPPCRCLAEYVHEG